MPAVEYFEKISPTGKTIDTNTDLKAAQPFTYEATAKFMEKHIINMGYKAQVFSPKNQFFYIIIQD
jgi:hypothetical protein